MTACNQCGEGLGSVLVCEACGALQAVADVDPFAAFGIPRAYAIDDGLLRKRLLGLSRRMHPDFFGGAGDDERALAERNSAELNTAHKLLADDLRRADLLVRSLGGPGEDEERQMPQAFLMEVLEWNELLEEARAAAPGSPERGRLDGLETTLRAERASTMESVAGLLTPLPDRGAPALAETRRHLNAVRYLDRTLHTLAELRLDHASSKPRT